MFTGYEQFWAAMLADPALAAEMLGREPYPRELAYAGSRRRPSTWCSRPRSPT